jgi:4-carboxymuconolactone decarboxylase
MTKEERDYNESVAADSHRRFARALTQANGSFCHPFSVCQRSRKVGEEAQRILAAIRLHASLSSRRREMTALVVAAYCGSRFEWQAHAPLAADADIDPGDIIGLAKGGLPNAPAGQRVVTMVRTILRGEEISDAAFIAHHEVVAFGGLVELTKLASYYQRLSSQLRHYN